MQTLDLGLDEISVGFLEDYLLASAYLIGFKNEKLHGRKYLDGGVTNNLPVNSLLERGYNNLIQILLTSLLLKLDNAS